MLTVSGAQCNLFFLMEGPLPSHGLLAFPSCTPRARGHSGGLGKGLLNEGQLLWEETSSHLPYQGSIHLDAVPRTPTWALRTRGPHSARCACSWGVIELTSWAPPDLVIRGVPGSPRLSLSRRGIRLHSEEPWFLLGEDNI